MNIGVDINSLGYDVMPDRFYIYADGHTLDSFLNREMATTIRNGYKCVALYSPSSKKTCQEYIHRLIGKAFIPNPKALLCMNHKDGNKLNNMPSNLEWCDKSHNNKHAYRSGLRKEGRGGGHNTPIKCVETGEKYKSITQAAEANKLKTPALCNCLSGRNKTCARLHWEYIN